MQIADWRHSLAEKIRRVDDTGFEALALETFHYQARHNPVYRSFIELTDRDPDAVDCLERVPFLPIQLFKEYDLKTGHWESDVVFSSSGTSGQQASHHHLRSPQWYRENAVRGFEAFYGNPENYCFLALLPAYLEREGSSLVYMVNEFIRASVYPESGFFLRNIPELHHRLQHCRRHGIPTVLIGVSFALWDLADTHPCDLSGVIIMETGGMKGRRREITRQELHRILCRSFQVPAIHSEYGMTELLSQAYSRGGGIFRPAPTMRVMTREINDPFAMQTAGRTGAINVVDLANLDTVSFIATDDLGRSFPDYSFEILGRLDASEVRGCNLLVGHLHG